MTNPASKRPQAAYADLLRLAIHSLAVGLATALLLAGTVAALAAVNDPQAGISELPRLLEHAQAAPLRETQAAAELSQ